MPSVLRHGLFYALIYIGTGVSMPYVPVWFRSVGLSAPEIGVILAAPMLGRVAAGTLVAIWADRFRLRRTPLAILALIAAVAYGALLVVKGIWLVMVAWFIGATAISAISPLADVLALIRSQEDGFQYTLARGCGSVAYLVGNIAGGAAVAATHPTTSVVWSAVAAGACALGGLAILPPEPVLTQEHGPPPPAREALAYLISDRTLMLCLAAISLIQGSHALYYGFSAISWTSHGIPAGYVGLLWGTSVAAEIALLWFGGDLRRRYRPEHLVLAGGVGAVLRWTLLALSPPLWLLFPIQALHALTFTATYIGGLELVDRLSPRSHASAAQSLSASLSYGLATGAATVACGWLYAHFQAPGYLAMSLAAIAGVMCALRLTAHPRIAAMRRATG